MRRVALAAIVVGVGGVAIVSVLTLGREKAPIVRETDATPPPARSIAMSIDASPAPRVPARVDAGAAWFIDERKVSRGYGECGGEEYTQHLTLRYGADGGAVSVQLAEIDYACPHGSETRFVVVSTFDFDDDGAPEAIVKSTLVGPQGTANERATIWTMKNGAVVHYTHEGGAPPDFVDVKDVDDDGRPDLLGRGGIDTIARPPCTNGNGYVIEPLFVFHSVKGGAFVEDALSKKALKEACDETFDEALAKDPHAGGLGRDIACARSRGVAPSKIEAALRKWCDGFSDDACTEPDDEAGTKRICPSWTLSLAKAPLPRRL